MQLFSLLKILRINNIRSGTPKVRQHTNNIQNYFMCLPHNRTPKHINRLSDFQTLRPSDFQNPGPQDRKTARRRAATDPQTLRPNIPA